MSTRNSSVPSCLYTSTYSGAVVVFQPLKIGSEYIGSCWVLRHFTTISYSPSPSKSPTVMSCVEYGALCDVWIAPPSVFAYGSFVPLSRFSTSWMNSASSSISR